MNWSNFGFSIHVISRMSRGAGLARIAEDPRKDINWVAPHRGRWSAGLARIPLQASWYPRSMGRRGPRPETSSFPCRAVLGTFGHQNIGLAHHTSRSHRQASTLSPHGVLCAITNARNSLCWGAPGARERRHPWLSTCGRFEIIPPPLGTSRRIAPRIAGGGRMSSNDASLYADCAGLDVAERTVATDVLNLAEEPAPDVLAVLAVGPCSPNPSPWPRSAREDGPASTLPTWPDAPHLDELTQHIIALDEEIHRRRPTKPSSPSCARFRASPGSTGPII